MSKHGCVRSSLREDFPVRKRYYNKKLYLRILRTWILVSSYKSSHWCQWRLTTSVSFMPSWDAKQLFIIFQTSSQHILHNKIASESSSKKLGSNSIKADVSCFQLNVNVLLTCLTARIQEIRPAGPCSSVLQLLDVPVTSSRIRPQIAAHHGHEHSGE